MSESVWKARASARQPLAQLEVVVELAVVGQPAGARAQGLVGALVQVDDAQAGVQQRDVASVRGGEGPVGGVVGTAMAQAGERQLHALGVKRSGSGVPGDPAHGV